MVKHHIYMMALVDYILSWEDIVQDKKQGIRSKLRGIKPLLKD